VKICIFTDSFLPRISGVSFAIINQANELVRRGHDVTVFRPRPHNRGEEGPTLDEVHSKATIRDIPVSFPDRRFNDLSIAVPTLIPSWNAVRDIQPDVIHVHTEWGCGWEGLALSRLQTVPLVGTFHTFFAEPEYLKLLYVPNTRLSTKMMWKYSIGFFNRCNVVIAPSRVVKEHLIQHGLKTEPVIMSNGIEMPPRLSDEEMAEKRREAGLPDGPHFIYIGRVSAEKSLDVALRAFRRVHTLHKKARFIIVGSGTAEKKLKKLTQRLHLQEAVIWYGHVNHDTLIAENIPRLGDIFITASKTENQPVSMLEAMSFGLPQVGPCAKGIPELIEDGVNGFLFAPDQAGQMARAMEQLYTDGALRAQMSQTALARAEMHNLPLIAEQLEHIYQYAMQKDKLHRGRRLQENPSLQWLLRKRKFPVSKPRAKK